MFNTSDSFVFRASMKCFYCHFLLYLGTRESPPLKVVGSSSNIEEMSLPSGTETRVYMTLSWVFLKRARKASCSESSWREKSKHSLRQ